MFVIVCWRFLTDLVRSPLLSEAYCMSSSTWYYMTDCISVCVGKTWREALNKWDQHFYNILANSFSFSPALQRAFCNDCVQYVCYTVQPGVMMLWCHDVGAQVNCAMLSLNVWQIVTDPRSSCLFCGLSALLCFLTSSHHWYSEASLSYRLAVCDCRYKCPWSRRMLC